MQNKTDGFSFTVKPSVKADGVGVFALHGIAAGTYMELFLNDFQEVLYSKEDVPEALQGYCIDQEGGKILCPKFFNRMDIGNYLNHSANNNVRYEKGVGFFVLRDIAKGEEILADYRDLEELETTWEGYYNR